MLPSAFKIAPVDSGITGKSSSPVLTSEAPNGFGEVLRSLQASVPGAQSTQSSAALAAQGQQVPHPDAPVEPTPTAWLGRPTLQQRSGLSSGFVASQASKPLKLQRSDGSASGSQEAPSASLSRQPAAPGHVPMLGSQEPFAQPAASAKLEDTVPKDFVPEGTVPSREAGVAEVGAANSTLPPSDPLTTALARNAIQAASLSGIAGNGAVARSMFTGIPASGQTSVDPKHIPNLVNQPSGVATATPTPLLELGPPVSVSDNALANSATANTEHPSAPGPGASALPIGMFPLRTSRPSPLAPVMPAAAQRAESRSETSLPATGQSLSPTAEPAPTASMNALTGQQVDPVVAAQALASQSAATPIVTPPSTVTAAAGIGPAVAGITRKPAVPGRAMPETADPSNTSTIQAAPPVVKINPGSATPTASAPVSSTSVSAPRRSSSPAAPPPTDLTAGSRQQSSASSVAPAVADAPIPAPSPVERKFAFHIADAIGPGLQPSGDRSQLDSSVAPNMLPVESETSVPAAATATSVAAAYPAGPVLPAAQVAPAVMTLAKTADGNQQMTVRLHPADLGTVQVRIERSPSGATQVEFTTDKADTLQALQRDQVALHRTLDDAGIPAAGRTITFHIIQTTSSSSTGAGPDQDRGHHAAPNWTTDSSTDPSGNGANDRGSYSAREANRWSSGRPNGTSASVADLKSVASAQTYRIGLDITA